MRQKDHPLYRTWEKMTQRCYNSNHDSFYLYGGRGISVCNRWRKSFWDFVSDVGEKPSQSHTLDRYPDNNGNYEPGNIRWATRSQQNMNRRDNVFITAQGKTQTLQEWFWETGFKPSTLQRRRGLGWSQEDIVGKPISDFSKRCRELGFLPQTIKARMVRKNITFEEAVKIQTKPHVKRNKT